MLRIEMAVPMISGRAPAQSIYDKGADAIAAHLDAGRDVAVLCEGDPLSMAVSCMCSPVCVTALKPGLSPG